MPYSLLLTPSSFTVDKSFRHCQGLVKLKIYPNNKAAKGLKLNLERAYSTPIPLPPRGEESARVEVCLLVNCVLVY